MRDASFYASEFNRIHTTSDLKRYALTCGSHFFDADTMRFFSSRLLESITRLTVDGEQRIYFITSERFTDYCHAEARLYTVRYVENNGSRDFTVREYGEFQQHRSAYQARKALATLVKSVTSN